MTGVKPSIFLDKRNTHRLQAFTIRSEIVERLSLIRCTQIVLLKHHRGPVKDGRRDYFSCKKRKEQKNAEPVRQLSTCVIVLWTQDQRKCPASAWTEYFVCVPMSHTIELCHECLYCCRPVKLAAESLATAPVRS